MKITAESNHANEIFSDLLIAENVHKDWIDLIVNLLNYKFTDQHSMYIFKIRSDEHKLYEFKP